MKPEDAIKIAKSKKSTTEQLKELLGVSDEVDLLLAKHSNTSAEILDDICERQSFNEKICGAALAHPNICAEQLLNVGYEYPLAMFRNPALPSLMQSRKNFLGEFSGDEFEDSFKKDIPAFVVDWLLSFGKAEYQVHYVSAPKRAPEVLERFRLSKHSKVVATLLDKDVSTYLAWAKDLGLVSTNDQLAPAELRSGVDAWVNWVGGMNPVVLASGEPFLGSTSILPPVLESALKSIEDLYFRSGPVAFNESLNFYGAFVDILHDVLKADRAFTNLVLKVIDFDLGEVKQFSNLGKKALANVSRGGYYAKSGVEKSFKRLAVVLANWSVRQTGAKRVEIDEALARLVSAHPLPSLSERDAIAATGAKVKNSQQAEDVRRPWDQDEAVYLAWATDLGFVRAEPEINEPASLKSEIDEWVEAMWDQNSALWKELVPVEGSAPSLQGELVRALGRIEAEHFKNGMMNWGDGSGYYESFTKLIHDRLNAEKTFSKLVKKVLDADIDQIKLSGQMGKAIASGKKPRAAAFGLSVLVQSDVEISHKRLGTLITIWCERHPDLIPFEPK